MDNLRDTVVKVEGVWGGVKERRRRRSV